MAGLMNMGRVALAAISCTLAACSALPDVTQVRAPTMDFSAFEMRDWNSYARSQAGTRQVTANDLVDPGGRCAGMPAADASFGTTPAPPVARGVGLDMTECEVVTSVGVPQTVDISTNERGERNVILTYTGTDRAGTYHFVAGRLVSLERGPEPPAPVQAQKKPPKKQAKPPRQQPTT